MVVVGPPATLLGQAAGVQEPWAAAHLLQVLLLVPRRRGARTVSLTLEAAGVGAALRTNWQQHSTAGART